MTDFSRFTAELVQLISKEMPETSGNIYTAILYADEEEIPPPPLFDDGIDLYVIIKRFSMERPEHLKASRTFEYVCNNVPATFTLSQMEEKP